MRYKVAGCFAAQSDMLGVPTLGKSFPYRVEKERRLADMVFDGDRLDPPFAALECLSIISRERSFRGMLRLFGL